MTMATINELVNAAMRRAAGRPVPERDPVSPNGKGDGGQTGADLPDPREAGRRMADVVRAEVRRLRGGRVGA